MQPRHRCQLPQEAASAVMAARKGSLSSPPITHSLLPSPPNRPTKPMSQIWPTTSRLKKLGSCFMLPSRSDPPFWPVTAMPAISEEDQFLACKIQPEACSVICQASAKPCRVKREKLTGSCCLQVEDVHILKHADTGRVKGAFVEFATQEDLQGGLTMSGHVSRNPLLVHPSQAARGSYTLGLYNRTLLSWLFHQMLSVCLVEGVNNNKPVLEGINWQHACIASVILIRIRLIRAQQALISLWLLVDACWPTTQS